MVFLLILFSVQVPVYGAVDFDIAGVSTTRVTGGVEPGDYSEYTSISSNGRYIAFKSYANNLTNVDNMEYYDIFVYDRVTDKIELVSFNESGDQFDWIEPYYPEISPDGDYVTFTAGAGLYIRDRSGGKTYKIKNYGTNWFASISGDNRYIAYSAGRTSRVYLYDRGEDHLFNTGDDITTEIGLGFGPVISADGRYITYENGSKIYFYDIATKTTTQVDVSSSGDPSNGSSHLPDISADGRFITFESSASNMTEDPINYYFQVYIHDRNTGTTEMVSKSYDGTATNGRCNSFRGPRISSDGNYVVFRSAASNLVLGDNNGDEDLFVRGISAGRTVRVNISSEGIEAGGSFPGSIYPSIGIKNDGNIIVAYSSSASNLVTGDTNGDDDIFVSEIYEDLRPQLEADQELNENNLDGRILTITLLDDPFSDSSLDINNFTLNNAPTGLSIANINHVSDIQCTIELASDGSDFDNIINNFSVTISGEELAGSQDLTSKTLSIYGAPEYGVFQFETDTYTISENTTPLTITVTRTGGSDGTSSLVFYCQDDTALDNVDYDAPDYSYQRSINFAEDETIKTFDIPIIDNILEDGNRSFYVYLYEYEGFNGSMGDITAVTVTITDDETLQPGQLEFSSLSYEVAEDGGSATITVNRINGSNGTVTVDYATSDGSAAGSDYTSTSDTLTFGEGETSQTFSIDITDDNELEGDETVNLILSNVTGGAALGTSAATLTIKDNEVVIPPAQLQIDETLLADGTVGEVYNHTFTASGGTKSYTFNVTGGSLPVGLNLANDGILSGTPAESGSFSFTVEVSDGESTDSHQFSLSISEAVLPPAQLQIDETSLADGTVGEAYNHTFTASGGTKNYTFSAAEGSSLPQGLSLTSEGVLSGIPTESGSFSFTVEVSDGEITDSAEFTLIINEQVTDKGQLVASAIAKNSVTLSWSALEGMTVFDYRLYVDENRIADGLPGEQTSYTVENLSSGTTYTFTLEASTDGENYIQVGVPLTVKTKSGWVDRIPPEWPRGSELTITNMTQTGLTLSWPKATDNVGVTDYYIYRNDKRLERVDADVRTINIDDLEPDTLYTFTVKAGDRMDNISRKNPTKTVKTVKLESIELIPDYAIGGDMSGRGIVTISSSSPPDGIEITLVSGDESIIEAPVDVTIDEGEVTGEFKFVISEVDKVTKASITAQLYDKEASDEFIVLPKAPIAYPYIIKDLGEEIIPHALNNKGEIAASSQKATGGYLITSKESTKLDGVNRALGINEKGNIVGTVLTSTNEQQVTSVNKAVKWQKDEIEKLGDLGGGLSVAYDINNKGQIVGHSVNKSGFTRGFIWENNKIKELGTLPEGQVSKAFALNDSGTVVGEAITVINYSGTHPNTGEEVEDSKIPVWRAVRYSPSFGIRDMGTLGGFNSSARDINEAGFVAGWAEDDNVLSEGGYSRKAFLCTPGLGTVNPPKGNWVRIDEPEMIVLGTLGGLNSEAYGLNNLRQVVGKSETGEEDESQGKVEHAFIYTQDKGMEDLNIMINPLLEWELKLAQNINDQSEIIGQGILGDMAHGFLLIPNRSGKPLMSINLPKWSIQEGGSASAILKLQEAAPKGGMEIELISGDPQALSVPEKIMVSEGEKEISFDISVDRGLSKGTNAVVLLAKSKEEVIWTMVDIGLHILDR